MARAQAMAASSDAGIISGQEGPLVHEKYFQLLGNIDFCSRALSHSRKETKEKALQSK